MSDAQATSLVNKLNANKTAGTDDITIQGGTCAIRDNLKNNAALKDKLKDCTLNKVNDNINDQMTCIIGPMKFIT